MASVKPGSKLQIPAVNEHNPTAQPPKGLPTIDANHGRGGKIHVPFRERQTPWGIPHPANME